MFFIPHLLLQIAFSWRFIIINEVEILALYIISLNQLISLSVSVLDHVALLGDNEIRFLWYQTNSISCGYNSSDSRYT